MKNYALLSRPEYFADLAKRISEVPSGERVVVAAMAFDITEQPIATLLEVCTAAASHGAQVLLLVDAINFLMDSHGLPGPLLVRRTLHQLGGTYGKAYEALESLRVAGGIYRITNIPKYQMRLPVSGRSHIKGAVIGNYAYIGGCNLERPEQLDIMVRWLDAGAADTLHAWLVRIADVGQTRDTFSDVDVETKLDDTTRLLLDAGVPKQSLIYDEALRLIDDATEWIYLTCQYFPGGTTARHLAAAQARGVRVAIDYSHPRSHGSAAALHQLHQLSQRARRLPSSLFSRRLDKYAPKLHAKILASEHEVMVGSHNYVAQGVQLGTAELALHSTDSIFGHSVCAFMQGQLAAVRSSPTRKPALPTRLPHD